MQKQTFLLLIFTLIAFNSCKTAKLDLSPQPSLSLSFQTSGGYNSGAVAYNPESKTYYAAVAGNSEFPLEIFDEKGEPIYQTLAGFDSRGMWWNPTTKAIERNGYGSNGWVSNTPSKNGLIMGSMQTIFKGQKQPNENACGVLDYDKNEVLFFNYGEVLRYDRNSGSEVGSISLIFNDEINDSKSGSEYPFIEFCMIYTGIKGKEIGIFNWETKQVILFDKNSGKQAEILQLPQNTRYNERFGLAYANNHIWIYEPDSRTWTGFKILKSKK